MNSKLRDADCCAHCEHSIGEDFEDGGYWLQCELHPELDIGKTNICDDYAKFI